MHAQEAVGHPKRTGGLLTPAKGKAMPTRVGQCCRQQVGACKLHVVEGKMAQRGDVGTHASRGSALPTSAQGPPVTLQVALQITDSHAAKGEVTPWADTHVVSVLHAGGLAARAQHHISHALQRALQLHLLQMLAQGGGQQGHHHLQGGGSQRQVSPGGAGQGCCDDTDRTATTLQGGSRPCKAEDSRNATSSRVLHLQGGGSQRHLSRGVRAGDSGHHNCWRKPTKPVRNVLALANSIALRPEQPGCLAVQWWRR